METKRYLAEHGPGDDRPDGHPTASRSSSRRPLQAIESLVETFSKERVRASRELDFTPWGGAYAACLQRPRPSPCEELFLLKHAVTVGRTPGPARRSRPALARALVGDGAPVGDRTRVPELPDPDLEDWPRAYHGTSLERLVRVKEIRPGQPLPLPQSVPSYGASTA